MLTREQKDKLEGLLVIPEVNSVHLQFNKHYNDVAIHLNKGSDLIPIEQAVGKILTTLETRQRGPLDIDNDVLYSAEIKTKEDVAVNIYVRRDKEELA